MEKSPCFETIVTGTTWKVKPSDEGSSIRKCPMADLVIGWMVVHKVRHQQIPRTLRFLARDSVVSSAAQLKVPGQAQLMSSLLLPLHEVALIAAAAAAAAPPQLLLLLLLLLLLPWLLRQAHHTSMPDWKTLVPEASWPKSIAPCKVPRSMRCQQGPNEGPGEACKT